MTLRIRLAALIFFSIVGVGSIIFVAKTHSDSVALMDGASLENQGRYFEISTTSLQSLPAATTSTKKLNLPILVYHIVRPAYPGDSRAVRAIALTPETFDAQMKYLGMAGYHVVRFSDLEAYFGSGTPLPPKPVILSFDDGWSDQFTYALPILEKYRYTATFFVFTNPIGTRGFLSWDNLRALLDAGMTIGAHTRSHPYLTKITDPGMLWKEIDGSKQKLEKKLNVPVSEFAYPFGQYNATVVAMVKKAGYASARGDYFSGEQAADRLYELSAMNAPTTTALFEEKF
ncbi:polysaccharide deacetylase family protein [Patescibacteria group bacterium]|nr:polysaccharide deacetylase family protein [Patescibacteria group bacterium]